MSADQCPYCGGDESKCDHDWSTDHCNQIKRRNDMVHSGDLMVKGDGRLSPRLIQDGEPPNPRPWPGPTPEMQNDPKFNAVWECIKKWDINVPDVYCGYCNANGNHVRAILDALAAVK